MPTSQTQAARAGLQTLGVPESLAADAVVRIEPPKGWLSLDLFELWAYRELLYFLIWRDVKIRYKQTAIGAAWAIFQPVLTMVVFTGIFRNIANVPSDGFPYPIFTY